MQTKPEIILELEKELNVSFLESSKEEFDNLGIDKNAIYVLENNEVIYLKLFFINFKNIPSAIAKLKKLEYLDLSYNSISDISNLKNLQNLKKLYLSDNKIIDFHQFILNNIEFVMFTKITNFS